MSETVVGQGDDLIAIDKVAKILSVSKSAAARIAADTESGFPQAFRLSARNIKYSRTEVIQWLRSRKGAEK